MRNQYDLYDATVGSTYLYLLQIRPDGVYTGDGQKIDVLPVTSSGGVVTGSLNIVEETFTLTTSSSYLLVLNKVPDQSYPVNVTWNGLWLSKGVNNDFVVSSSTVQINPLQQLEKDDVIIVSYYY